MSREYASLLRAEQARATRARIVDAARGELLTRGYPATTMSGVAKAAGVAVQTLYNAFGSKAELVKAVWDVTLVGDDEPVPFGDRPEVRAMAESVDGREYLTRYAGFGRLLLGRLSALHEVLVAGAAAGDPELRAVIDTLSRERMVGATQVAQHLADRGWLRPGLSVERAADAVWTLDSGEVFRLLVSERGWSLEEYEEWLAAAMVAATLPPAHGRQAVPARDASSH